MSNLQELSSSLSNPSSSYVSNGSSNYMPPISAVGNGNISPEPGECLQTVTLSRLSFNLERLLSFKEFDCTDAEIEVEGAVIGVHRCILAVRSNFFCGLFSKEPKPSSSGSGLLAKPKYLMSDLVPNGHVGREALEEVLWYLYTGRLKAPDPSVSTCVAGGDCTHDACRPAIGYAIELMYASHAFQIEELVSLLQRLLLDFVEKALVEDLIPILLVSFHAHLSLLINQCIKKLVWSDLDSALLQKELPNDLAKRIISDRVKFLQHSDPAVDPTMKGVRRIHGALDSDDVELVKMLLTESGSITLDDAYALHYAAAYCDPKIVSEVLGLGLADVNLRNSRGFTPLHVAAMRKEPAVIIALLKKGASPSVSTIDGLNAVNICKRLTRAKDYDTRTEKGMESNNSRICIDILDRELQRESRRNSLIGEGLTVSHAAAENLQQELLYYETRVALAKILYPAEARVAMQIAETTSSYNLCGKRGSSGQLKEVDLNETPAMRDKRIRFKLEALKKTVENGRQFFPHCSEVLDKWVDDEHTMDLSSIEQSADEQDMKRRRFDEIKDDVRKAFYKDKADKGLSASSASSPGSKSGRKHGRVLK